jgi:hypothetical protein
MLNYQIRLLDSGGMNLAHLSRTCRDDHEAMKLAESLISGGGIAHIWEGSRSIGQVFLPLPKAAE